MNWYSKIYWLTRLDSINVILFTFVIIFIIGVVVWLLVTMLGIDEYDSPETTAMKQRYLRYFKKIGIPLFIFSLLGLIFIPTKSDMIIIISGGKVGEYMDKDTSLNKIPGQSAEYLSKLLQQQIDNLKKDSHDH